MDSRVIASPTRWPLDRLSRWVLVATLCMGLSILYQIYIYDFTDGVLSGGERERLALKILFSAGFMYAVRNYLSVSALTLNLILKLPLLFLVGSITVAAPFTDSLSAQAVNLFFFLPILLVDWGRPGGDALFRAMWRVIAVVTVIQLVLDPLFKWHFKVGWGNAALVGGMGNPNVYGVFLIVSGLACAILLKPRFRLLSTILFLVTPLTGSLASALVGLGCALVQGCVALSRQPGRVIATVGIGIAVLLTSTTLLELLSDSNAITHAISKLNAAIDLFSGGGGGQSLSVSLRVEYTRFGLALLADSPLAILTGHPEGMPMYSGDGMWIQLLVSYGLPLTLAVLAVNTVVILRGLRSRDADLQLAACVVMVIMAFFVTNRIIDYWPVSLVYLLAFTYLTNRGPRRIVASHPSVEQRIE